MRRDEEIRNEKEKKNMNQWKRCKEVGEKIKGKKTMEEKGM